MQRKDRPNNLTIPVNAELRNFVEREAERAERSLAGQVRYLLQRALEAQQAQQQKSTA